LAVCAEEIEVDFGESPVIPTRSVLYHLKPIARGTSLRESLFSFMLRLADQHTIHPSRLPFAPGIDPRCCGRWARNVWTQSCFKGAGVVAKIWAGELARFTGHHSLEDLTLLPLARVVNVGGLAHKARKWCPRCLREQEREGVPYGQLLWDIAAVNACPVHTILFVSRCQCGETDRRRPMTKYLPHVCQYCRRTLIEPPRLTQAPLELVQRARMVADLLDDPDFDRGRWPADGLSQFLIGAARRHFGGRLAPVATTLGLNKVTVHGWVRNRRRPHWRESLSWPRSSVARSEAFFRETHRIRSSEQPHR
jgi:TniQ